MDPTAYLKRIGAPKRVNSDVRDAVQDLMRWLDCGGSAPDWRTSERGTARFQRYAPSTFKRYCDSLTAVKAAAPTELAPALSALHAQCVSTGWPIRFASDLDHDALAIGSMLPREPFAWCLRTDGTHIARVRDLRATGQLTMRMVENAFGAENCRFYVWDGSSLQTADDAESADAQLAVLAERRYEVRSHRACSLIPHRVATEGRGEILAAEWALKYGEPFIVTDTWSK